MVASVVYPGQGASGCEPFEGDKPFKTKLHRPTILLLDRGGILFIFYFSLFHLFSLFENWWVDVKFYFVEINMVVSNFSKA